MNSKRFLLGVAVALAILAGYNAVVRRLARTSQRQHMLATLDAIPAGTDCVFLGNSLMDAGADAAAFADAWPRASRPVTPINLALGGSSPVEHYLVLKRAYERGIRPRFLVYGFFDDQLNAVPRGPWSDLVGNRAFAYYFPDAAAQMYAPDSSLKRWQLGFTGKIPILAERSSLWTKVELLRRKLSGVGLPPERTNRFGRASDFASLEAADLDSFNRRCGAVVEEQRGFSAPVREILRLAREHGTKVVLVEMPLPTRHRETFYASPVWPRLRDYLQSLSRQEGAFYLGASDWIPEDAKFDDATHLNAAGAKAFSRRLAGAVAELERRQVEMAGPL